MFPRILGTNATFLNQNSQLLRAGKIRRCPLLLHPNGSVWSMQQNPFPGLFKDRLLPHRPVFGYIYRLTTGLPNHTFVFCCFVWEKSEMGSYIEALIGMEYTIQNKLALNSWQSFFLCFLSAGVGVIHHDQFPGSTLRSGCSTNSSWPCSSLHSSDQQPLTWFTVLYRHFYLTAH